MDKYSVLKTYFGYENFKYPQDRIIDEVLANYDVIAVLPTGFGKSVIFQVLALMQEGISIIISPLIALMQDQVHKLKAKGVPAVYINSNLDSREQMSIYRNLSSLKILYLSPERLESKIFLAHISKVKISMVVVDEAHTILWAEGFRLSFGQIHSFIETLSVRPRLLALTATATPGTIEKIHSYLKMVHPKVIEIPMDRPNLFYKVETPKNKLQYLKNYILHHKNEKGIIYCLTRREVENLHQSFLEFGISNLYYHGGLAREEREINQAQFSNGQCNLMICTNAFGMGIDIPDIRYVIEYSIPQSIEDLVQQLGRASRDGAYGEGILLFSFQDIKTVQYFIEQQEDKKIKKEAIRKLDALVEYCLTKSCRHQWMSSYFHNSLVSCKTKCDNCKKKGR